MINNLKYLINEMQELVPHPSLIARQIEHPSTADTKFKALFNDLLNDKSLDDPDASQYEHFKYGTPVHAFSDSTRSTPEMLATLYNKFKGHRNNQPFIINIAGNSKTPAHVLKDISDNIDNQVTNRTEKSAPAKKRVNNVPKMKAGPKGLSSLIELLRSNPNTPEDALLKHQSFVSPFLSIKPNKIRGEVL